MRLYVFTRTMLVTLVLGLLASPVMAGSAPLAVFEFELIDTSLQGETVRAHADEQRRLAMISDQLRWLLTEDGYTLVDLTPAAETIRKSGFIHQCNGCAAEIAKPLGARLALTGTVQKVSELILNINVYVWDTASERERYQTSVDIRGNNDESWSRGLSYLARNRLLPALSKLATD